MVLLFKCSSVPIILYANIFIQIFVKFFTVFAQCILFLKASVARSGHPTNKAFQSENFIEQSFNRILLRLSLLAVDPSEGSL